MFAIGAALAVLLLAALAAPASAGTSATFTATATSTASATWTSTATSTMSATVTSTGTASSTLTATSTSTPTAVIPPGTEIIVHPNPAAGSAAHAFLWVAESSRITLEVWDLSFDPMTRVEVAGGPGYVSIPFDISKYGAGVYVYRALVTAAKAGGRVAIRGPKRFAVVR